MDRTDRLFSHPNLGILPSQPRLTASHRAQYPLDHHVEPRATSSLSFPPPSPHLQPEQNSIYAVGRISSQLDQTPVPILNTAPFNQASPYPHSVYATPSNFTFHPTYQHQHFPHATAIPPTHPAPPLEGPRVDESLTPHSSHDDLYYYYYHPQYAYCDQINDAEADPPIRAEEQSTDLHDQIDYPSPPVPGDQVSTNAEPTLATPIPVNITVADIVTQLLHRVFIESDLQARWTSPNGILFRQAYHIDTQPWKMNQTEEPPVTKGELNDLVKYVSKRGTKLLSRFDSFMDRQGSRIHCLWIIPSGRCGHTTTRRGSMRSHIRGHFSYSPYACNGKCNDTQCDERFTCKELFV